MNHPPMKKTIRKLLDGNTKIEVTINGQFVASAVVSPRDMANPSGLFQALNRWWKAEIARKC